MTNEIPMILYVTYYLKGRCRCGYNTFITLKDKLLSTGDGILQLSNIYSGITFQYEITNQFVTSEILSNFMIYLIFTLYSILWVNKM